MEAVQLYRHDGVGCGQPQLCKGLEVVRGQNTHGVSRVTLWLPGRDAVPNGVQATGNVSIALPWLRIGEGDHQHPLLELPKGAVRDT